MYNDLINKKYKEQDLNKYAQKWYVNMQMEYKMEQYLQQFTNLRTVTSSIKLRDFQYRLLLGKIFTNDILSRWKIKNSSKCEYCRTEQTILHLKVECKTVQIIWNEFHNSVQVPHTEWNPYTIMSNCVHAKVDHVINLVVLIIKQFLYRQKCTEKPISVKLAWKEIKDFHNIEKYNAQRDCQTACHNLKWSPVEKILNSEM